MEGILISLDCEAKRGQVDTRNDNIGILTIYFQEIPDVVQMDSTIEFDIAISRIGNRYAKFISVADRNQALFNTEDRTQ